MVLWIDSSTYLAWDRCNSMVISWLIVVLDLEKGKSIINFSTTREAWLDLQERFGQSSSTQLCALQHEISKFWQGNLSIVEYYTKLKSL